MKWLAALAAVVVSVVAVRAQLRPPDPQIIRIESQHPAGGTAAARGKLLYERYGCVMCHGADGKGGFANPNAETDGKVPAVVFVKEGYTAAEVAEVIRNGKPRIGRADPKGPIPPYRMPGWRDRLSNQDIADLTEYLMSLYPKSAAEKWR